MKHKSQYLQLGYVTNLPPIPSSSATERDWDKVECQLEWNLSDLVFMVLLWEEVTKLKLFNIIFVLLCLADIVG